MPVGNPAYRAVVDEIADPGWSKIDQNELLAVAQAYYYFSLQFCETVDIACRLHPADEQLLELRAGECDTENLSPYPGVAEPGETMSHEEFMRRVLAMSSLDRDARVRVDRAGADYLAEIRRIDEDTRIMSLPVMKMGDWRKSSVRCCRLRIGMTRRCRRFATFLSGISGSTATRTPAMARCAVT